MEGPGESVKRNEVALLDGGQRAAAPAEFPNILYLAGMPRTGSTLLGQIIGRMPGVIFVGELSLFWRRFGNGELCSCGQALPSCPFWSAVISKGFGELKLEDARKLGQIERALRWIQIISSLLPMRRKITRFGRFRVIADARTQLYSSIANVAQVKWIADSGKDPWFGGLLGNFFEDNLHTVHIVRDPRGVAFSWTKKVRSDSEPVYMKRRHPAITAYNWLIQNLVIQVTLQRPRSSYVRVQYEDLATNPEAVINKIARSMGIEADLVLTVDAYEDGRDDLHWVAGNPGVRQSAGTHLQIKLDEEWRDRLHPVQRWLVTAICGALFWFYGYRL
jgi:Sulfotransferase family